MKRVPLTSATTLPGTDPDILEGNRYIAVDGEADTRHQTGVKRTIQVAVGHARLLAKNELFTYAELGDLAGFVNVTESVSIVEIDNGYHSVVVSIRGDGVTALPEPDPQYELR